ncbi:MAG TPA: hypothetical protein VMQ56_11860 [Terracidiphilus sp.]|nr:hypothetical protein [Terracidiphilus sp.]
MMNRSSIPSTAKPVGSAGVGSYATIWQALVVQPAGTSNTS